MNVGLEFESHIRGVVSPYEENDAARVAGIPWPEWRASPWWERARAVAYYRYHRLVEATVSEVVQRESERRASLRKGAGRGH